MVRVMLNRIYSTICIERVTWGRWWWTYALLWVMRMCVINISRPRGLVLNVNMVWVVCELVRDCGRLRRVEHSIWANAILHAGNMHCKETSTRRTSELHDSINRIRETV
jgi:hypothetical protein